MIISKSELMYQEIARNIFQLPGCSSTWRATVERLRFIARLRRGHVQNDNFDTSRIDHCCSNGWYPPHIKET